MTGSSDSKSLATDKIDVPSVHDRIAEAYFGKMGDVFMRETHDRLHWICRQAAGESVLDIGCSQGIVSILLGREGKKVLGIDSDTDAIAFAEQLLAQERSAVRERVSFLADDAGKFVGSEKFDTVILAEVLEHLIQPEALISLASNVLAEDGSLIVTVPFGINDYFDHKRTYYLLEPYKLISTRFTVTEVEVMGKWIGFVAVKRRAVGIRERFELDQHAVALLESGFHNLERGVRTDLAVARRELASLRDARSKLSQRADSLDKDVARLNERVQSLSEVESGAAESLAEVSKATSRADRAEAVADALEARVAEGRERVANLEGDISRLSERLKSFREVEARVEACRIQLATESARADLAEAISLERDRNVTEEKERVLNLERELIAARDEIQAAKLRASELQLEHKALKAAAARGQQIVDEFKQRAEVERLELQTSHDSVVESLEERVAYVTGDLQSERKSKSLLEQRCREVALENQALKDAAAREEARMIALTQRAEALSLEIHAAERREALLLQAEGRCQALALELKQANALAAAAVEQEQQALRTAQSARHMAAQRIAESERLIANVQSQARSEQEEFERLASGEYQNFIEHFAKLDQELSDSAVELALRTAQLDLLQRTRAFQLGSILLATLRSVEGLLKAPLRIFRLLRAAVHHADEGIKTFPRIYVPDLPEVHVSAEMQSQRTGLGAHAFRTRLEQSSLASRPEEFQPNVPVQFDWLAVISQ